MNGSFTPSFQHFHKDVERYLKSEGKCEKNEHGQTVYRGYPAALAQMFRTYIEKEAFAPLVAEFRKWNWEWSYDDYLLELTSGLQQNKRLATAQRALGGCGREAQNQLQQDQKGSEVPSRKDPGRVSDQNKRSPSGFTLPTSAAMPPSLDTSPMSERMWR